MSVGLDEIDGSWLGLPRCQWASLHQWDLCELRSAGRHPSWHFVRCLNWLLSLRPQVYVQDLLRNKLEAKACRLLHEEEGHLYVCGDVRMAREVARTVKEMFARQLGLTEEQAEDYCFQLKVSKPKPLFIFLMKVSRQAEMYSLKTVSYTHLTLPTKA